MNLKRIYQRLFIILIFSFSILSCTKNNEKVKVKPLNNSNDSIILWIKASKNKSFSINQRKDFLIKSYQAIKSSKIDTSQVRNLSIISYQSYKLGDTLLFKRRNKETLAIAKKLKDTFAIGDVHWNYASYYNNKQVYDNAYHHFNLAHINFDKKNYLYESAKTQYGMAFIKGRFKDYSGSEVLTFKAIEKFKKIKNYKSLFACYNHLGQLQNDIEEYERGLFYYDKALEYLNKLKNNQSLYEAIYNNIANIYVKQKEYIKALKYYNTILANDCLKSKNIDSYAGIIDNKAYCRFLMNDTVNVVKPLNIALNIRDSINNREGIIISKMHLGQYYAFKQKTSTAINYIKEANSLAKEIKNSRDYLESLFLLSKLDNKHSSEYLKKYIKFSDSIQITERKVQNKFTRIAYETDEYIEENKQLSQQKIWILITGFGLISILGLVYFLKVQKSKNEKLLLENEQQKANEQVYLITLKQQEKLEKEKIKEQNRIAEELHDGILGKLFGTRLGLGFLDIKTDNETQKQYQLFLKELQTIEKEIRDVSHKLSINFDTSKAGFINIITQFIESKQKTGKFKSNLEFDNNINWDTIDEIVKVNLYRIAQEIIVNSIKHASANTILIQFKLIEKEILSLTIKDDGCGFNTKQKIKGIGLKHIKSRTKRLNGMFSIQSQINKGTIINIKIPL